MKKYNRIMLGRACRFAKMCREEGYIGANFNIRMDLSDSLPENWRLFNEDGKCHPLPIASFAGANIWKKKLCSSYVLS